MTRHATAFFVPPPPEQKTPVKPKSDITPIGEWTPRTKTIVVESYLQGFTTAKHLLAKHGVTEDLLRGWVAQYEETGYVGAPAPAAKRKLVWLKDD